VSGGSKLLGERHAPGRQPMCVMEQKNLGHVGGSLTSGSG
jgi:hypothetical protein